MIKFLKQKNKGFTLVETLISISIFSVSIVSLMSILGSGLSNTGYAKQKMTAGYLAQEGIEILRNKRDNYVLYPASSLTWTDFESLIVTDPSFFPSPDSNFTRTFNKQIIDLGKEVKISSTVCWPQQDCNSATYKVTLTENLYNWVENN
jgi:prepilin-type N-terminal cleavage/methylation domain-containing protein